MSWFNDMFSNVWKVGKLGSAFIPGVGPFISGGMHLAETASKGSKGKWGLDELLAMLPIGAKAGVPGLNKIPLLGGSGGDPTNGGLGSFAGEISSTGQPLSNGFNFGNMNLGSILGGIGGTIKKHPLETALLLSSVTSGRDQRKTAEAERLLMELQGQKMKRNEALAGPARQALDRFLAQGPYSRQMPDMSSIFRS